MFHYTTLLEREKDYIVFVYILSLIVSSPPCTIILFVKGTNVTFKTK